MPLVVSLSGLDCQLLEECASFAAELDRRSVPLSLLLSPRGTGQLLPAPPVLSWVVQRLQHRDALILHGFARGEAPWQGLLPRLHRRRLGEGGARGTALRLVAVTRRLAGVGLRTGAFVPSRWFASPGTITALRRHGFAVCADAVAIRELRTGRVHRARVHALGSGERAEPWWCRALVMGVGRAARRGKPVRIAAEAADLRKPGARQALLDAVDLALHHRALPATYGEFGSDAQVKIP